MLKYFLGGKIRCSNAASDERAPGVPGVGGLHKIRKLLIGLAEAVRERLLQHLESARSLAFHSDANKNRQLLLCQFCGADLQPQHGPLGTQPIGDDSSAAWLAIVIFANYEELVHAAVGAPLTSQPDTVTDLSMLSHITCMVEVFNADAAADEQLAGQMLQLGGEALVDLGGAGTGSGAPVLSSDLFPHLKIINQDKTMAPE